MRFDDTPLRRRRRALARPPQAPDQSRPPRERRATRSWLPASSALTRPSPITARLARTLQPEDSGRYGRIGVVSWSFAQTLIGAAITLVPWVTLVLLSQTATPAPAGKAQPVSHAQDLILGLSALLLTSIVEAAFLVAPLYYALRTRPPGAPRREGLRTLGFRRAPLRLSLALVASGLVVSLIVAVLYDLIVQQFHLGLRTNAQTLQDQVRATPFTVISILIGAVVVAPFCEEIFFRGFLFPGLLRGMRLWPAVILSAALFTLAHGDLGSAAPLFVLGMLLPLLRWRTGSIWPGIALHIANNALASALIIAALFGP